MGISQKSIGLFDDDSDIVGLLEEWLSEFFVHVEGHTSIQLPLLQRYDLAVVDWHMQHRADLLVSTDAKYSLCYLYRKRGSVRRKC